MTTHPLVQFFVDANDLVALALTQRGWVLTPSVDPKTIMRWENNLSTPSWDNLSKVAEALLNRLAEPSCVQLRKNVFDRLKEMDSDAPTSDHNDVQFLAYVKDVALRCEAIATLNVFTRHAGEKSFKKVTEKGGAPVRKGSCVKISVQLTHPLFVYVVWIDSGGRVIPIYPWQGGDWSKMAPQSPSAAGQIELPTDTPYWGIDTDAGAETCVAMTSVFRLSDERLKALGDRLKDLPAPRQTKGLPPVKTFRSEDFEQGAGGLRLNIHPEIPESELLEWRHRTLAERLRAPGFDHIAGISFANVG